MWTLWKTRNDLLFNDKVIPTPEAVIYKMVSFLSHWKKLLTEKNVHRMEVMIGEIQQACGLDA
ncbi:taxadien-5-alpha-ol O-acetyltransferase-like [Panicum miliaceum]|uniref:Taxadien-5-alpha-ol O-acetyltransferase-like n=1 Tax=Panicum miliaceum TaxID=4540 RepID=A0A3L6S345_PANMI|nr:taxadien-5-alpha-ol O-acetyltransferase-like [Panicum miliaceum]